MAHMANPTHNALLYCCVIHRAFGKQTLYVSHSPPETMDVPFIDQAFSF
jgi:hypothetical protein